MALIGHLQVANVRRVALATGEGGAVELRALIGVEYFRRAVPRQRFVERRDAKARIRSTIGRSGTSGILRIS